MFNDPTVVDQLNKLLPELKKTPKNKRLKKQILDVIAKAQTPMYLPKEYMALIYQ
jgi:hypothetical protein